MDNIKPCPFCGQEPDVTDPDFCHPVTQPNEFGAQLWRAGCIECHGGCGAEVLGITAEQAIEMWNTRTNEQR